MAGLSVQLIPNIPSTQPMLLEMLPKTQSESLAFSK